MCPPKMLLLLFFLSFCPWADALKILVSSPSMSRSHLISNARVADSLAKDGHDVTLLEVEYSVTLGAFNASKLAKVRRIHGHFLRLSLDGKEEDLHSMVIKMSFQHLSLMTAIRKYFFFSKFMDSFIDACGELIVTQKKHWELLKAEKFDLLIGEQFDFCSAGLAHVLGIPTYVLLSSCPLQENTASFFGLPSPSSWVPTVESNMSDKMSLLGRLGNWLRQMLVTLGTGKTFSSLTAVFRKQFGEDFPDLVEIVKNSPFILVNADEFVDFPRPIFSNIVYIGGLGMESAGGRELEEPFRSEMSRGEKGVVLFSLGSIIRSTDLPERFRQNVFEAFSHFPDYHFIVRLEKEDNFSMEILRRSGVQNVFPASWIPQMDLLTHPRLKLFISHGGYNSLMETARAGVPLLAMGFFADQFRNARIAERNGWALAFDKLALLEGSDKFREAIGQVLGEASYAANATRIRRIIQTKPFSAEERLQKSIRFLELNGGHLPELLPESRNMGAVALYNLDLALIAGVAMAILLTAMSLLANLIRKRIWALLLGQKKLISRLSMKEGKNIVQKKVD